MKTFLGGWPISLVAEHLTKMHEAVDSTPVPQKKTGGGGGRERGMEGRMEGGREDRRWVP